jgi:hypothetical protein
VELRVCDDGLRFDPSGVEPGELELGIMHEPAQSIGASLQIDSPPSHGTQSTVVWRGWISKTGHLINTEIGHLANSRIPRWPMLLWGLAAVLSPTVADRDRSVRMRNFDCR